MESCPTQVVVPLVGLAAEKVIRDRYVLGRADAMRRHLMALLQKHSSWTRFDESLQVAPANRV
ncbi:MAG: hypothetical protein ACQESR_07935 [Planctomycetota bacterium]